MPVILPICNFGLFRYNLKLISEDLYGILNKKINKKFSPVIHFACCNRQKSPVLLMNMLVLSKTIHEIVRFISFILKERNMG